MKDHGGGGGVGLGPPPPPPTVAGLNNTKFLNKILLTLDNTNFFNTNC